MRAFLIAGAIVLAVDTTGASADPKQDAVQVVERWAKAFTDSDVDGIVALYAPDALFLGTQSKAVVADPSGIRKHFENALLNNRPRGARLNDHTVLAASDSAVVDWLRYSNRGARWTAG